MNRSRITGDLTASGLLYADIANDRVGIGSTIPGNKLSLPDSAKIGLGNGEDLTLYHNATRSYIQDNVSNDLRICSNAIRFRSGADGATSLYVSSSGETQIYHNGNVKLETTSTGVNITGTVTDDGATHDGDVTFTGATSGRNVVFDKSENSLEFGDYTYAKFGVDEDLTVWSNNTASAINNKTGELRILSGTNVRILKRSDAGLGFAAQVANFNIDGACDLWHNGTKRIETTNTGAVVTGILTATGNVNFAGDVYSTSNNPWIYTSNGGSGVRAGIGLDGTNQKIDFSTAGSSNVRLSITSAGAIQCKGETDVQNSILRVTDSTPRIIMSVPSGGLDTRLYNDGSGNFIIGHGTNSDAPTERLRINSSGRIAIGNNPTVHSDYILHIEDTGETNIKIEGSTSTLGARISLQNNDTTANSYSQYAFNDAGGQSTCAIKGINTDQTNNYGELAFLTRNAQGTPPEERMRITKDGQVAIRNVGSTSVSANLIVYGDADNTDVAIFSGGAWNRGLKISTAASGNNDAVVILDAQNADNGCFSFKTHGDERLHITANGCTYGSNFGFGDDAHWKIRPNTSNTELAFEYATSSTLADTNIKMFLNPSGRVLIKSVPAAAGGTMGDYGIMFQASSAPTNGQVIQGITFNPHHTQVGRARAGIAALAHGSSHPHAGADLSFMTRYSADGHDLDVTADQKLRIDINGDFMFNTPTLSGMNLWNMTGNDQRARYQFWQKTGTYRGAAFHEDRGDANGMDIILSKSRGGAGAGVLNAGDWIGRLMFAGADGTRCVNAGYVGMLADSGSTVASDRIPSKMVFGTHLDSASGLGTRMTLTKQGRLGIGIDPPEAVLHPRANPDHGTDVAFQVGTGNRFFKLEELGGQDNFSRCYMSFYDNSLREIITLENSYAGATSMGNQIVWRGHAAGKTGDIRVYNTAVNSVQSKMDMSASGGVGIEIDHNGHVTKPNQPYCDVTLDTNRTCGARGVHRFSDSGGFGGHYFTNVRNNQGSHYNSGNSRFTIPTTGKYLICMNVALTGSNPDAYYAWEWYRNGSRGFWGGWQRENHSGYHRQTSTTIWYLSKDDYLEPSFETDETIQFQGSTNSNSRYTGFSIMLLG